MIIHNVTQGTPEWHAARLGKFTASKFGDLMMAKTTAGYEKAILRVVYERLTGEAPDDFKSAYMERGNELEADGLELYSDRIFQTVDRVGFVERDEWSGCSPDGLVGSEGMVQVKCPAFHTMVKYLLKKEVPGDYYWQIQGEMLITGRSWSDFMAYHPKLEPVIVRMFADPSAQARLDLEIRIATEAAKTILNKLKPQP